MGRFNYKEYKERIKIELKKINDSYEKIISFVKKLTPVNFVTNFLNKNMINYRKYLINIHISKKLQIDVKMIIKIMENLKKKSENDQEILMEEKIDKIIESAHENAKLNAVKKYLTKKIDIEPFPLEKKTEEKMMKMIMTFLKKQIIHI